MKESGNIYLSAMRAVDTNVVVRLMTRDDPQQTDDAENFVEDGAWVPLIALLEAVWVLGNTYELGSADLVGIIDGLLNHQHLVLQEPEIVAAALELFRARPSLGFSDSLILEISRKAGHLPLGTFGKALSRADGAQRL